MQLDVGDDRLGNLVDLLGLLVGPHGGTELCGVLVGVLAERGLFCWRLGGIGGVGDRGSDIPSELGEDGNGHTRTSGWCSLTLDSTSSISVKD